jgi:hypothetical protein
MSRLSKNCGILDVSEPYRLPRPVNRRTFIFFTYIIKERQGENRIMVKDDKEILTLLRRIWDYWVLGLCSSSDILMDTTVRKLDLFPSSDQRTADKYPVGYVRKSQSSGRG